MKSISFTVLIYCCLLLTSSCSFGEDLERDTITKKNTSATKAQSSPTDIDKPSGRSNAGNEARQYAQAGSEQGIKFPKISSVSVESENTEEGQKILKVVINLLNGSPEEFDFTYKWFYKDQEIFGEVDDIIAWNDEYKKGEKIRVQVIPPNVDEETFLLSGGEFIVPNSPPVISSEPPTEIRGEDKLFEYKVETQDPDGDNVELVLKKSPKGMTIEPATGLIKWDFTDEKAGSEYKIEIIATDTDGESYIQEITLTIPSGQGGADRGDEGTEELVDEGTEDLDDQFGEDDVEEEFEEQIDQ